MFKISELIQYMKANGMLVKEPETYNDAEINRFASLQHPSCDALCWSQKEMPVNDIPESAVLLCQPGQEHNPERKTVMLHVNDPRRIFGALAHHFVPETRHTGISAKAVIDPTAEIGENVYIGPYVIIEEGCKIGDGTRIEANAVIYRNVRIGKNCHIWSGAVIGADGHGYFLNEEKLWTRVRHMGGVVIGDNVEIKANSCVDRGVLDDTTIGDNTKIDNLVQVAHNVVIGKNCFVAAGAIIAGSCIIEDNCWLAPGSVIRNGVHVARHSQIGMNAVVYRSIKQTDTVYAGNPATAVKKYEG